MISAGDFRNGLTLEIDGQVMQVLEFQHVKPGKGAAFVRTKMKNVIDGGVVEKTFRPTEKFPQARIDRVDMQYLYQDGDLYNFMNVETYDQIAIGTDIVGDNMKFVQRIRICHRGTVVRRTGSDRDRAGCERQHRDRRDEAGDCRDRRAGYGSVVCQHRRQAEDRYENRGISFESMTDPERCA